MMPSGQRYDEERRISTVLRELQSRGWAACVDRRVGTAVVPPSEFVPKPEPFRGSRFGSA